jgi:glycosyltransferase involved in cell wall biosynthesis
MNSDNPLVSILIPVYGVERYIVRCLESVENQTYDNIEVILVNDCTPDRSIEVAEEYLETSRLKGFAKIVSHEKNRGLSAARNTAVKAANGDYILHLDSDDYIDKNTVNETVRLAKQQNADAVLFGFTHKYKTFETVEHIIIPKEKTDCLNLILQRRIPVCLCGGLYKRELYRNGVEELEGYDYEEDYVTKPRLLYYANKIVAYDKPFYIYNHQTEGSMTKTFKHKCIEDTIVTLDNLRDFFSSVSDAESYEHSLDVAAIKLKANLLRTWCLSKGGNDDWIQIRNMYLDIPISKGIGGKDYITLILAHLNMPGLTRFYNRNGNRLKSLYKHLVVNK